MAKRGEDDGRRTICVVSSTILSPVMSYRACNRHSSESCQEPRAWNTEYGAIREGIITAICIVFVLYTRISKSEIIDQGLTHDGD